MRVASLRIVTLFANSITQRLDCPGSTEREGLSFASENIVNHLVYISLETYRLNKIPWFLPSSIAVSKEDLDAQVGLNCAEASLAKHMFVIWRFMQ